MKKIFILFVLGVILLAGAAFAESLDLTTDEGIEEFVKDVAQQKGIEKETIRGVEKLNFEDLPKEVNLKNIDETNLAIYKLDIEAEEKPIYIITASTELFKETVKKFNQRMLLNFGFSGESVQTTYLKTATGVTTSLKKGYVMTRSGSIVALSTNLEILTRSTNDAIDIVLYKNGKTVGFKNTFNEDSIGIYNDYDTISSGILNFEKGDVISMEVTIPSGSSASDITTLMEIETIL